MIVDHRTYTIYPGKMPAFLKAYGEEGWPLQQKHLGDCVGWYVSMDIGQLNQVVHMWRYKDLADRAARRGGLLKDPAWLAYLEKAASFVQHQENKILTAAPFYDSTTT